MNDPAIDALAKLRAAQQDHAMGAIQFPRKKKFDHGVEVGVYQGLQQAIEIVEAALKDDDEQQP